MNDRILTPAADPDDDQVEVSLRPRLLAEYIGQQAVKDNLTILLQAARARSEAVEHILICGPPGLGKTTLANVIANELAVNLVTTSGPAIEHAGALGSIFMNQRPKDVLFIDEIHRLPRLVEETLYSAMEDFTFDFVTGKGAGATVMHLPIPRITMVGATTRQGLLSAPLRDRFGAVYRLEFYSTDELYEIISRAAGIIGVSVTNDAAHELAARSRGTPRIANRLLRRVRDYAQVRAHGKVDLGNARTALELLKIDSIGLDQLDRRILLTVIEKFQGGPVGLDTLATSLQEEPETIEDVYEPYLLQIGFLARTSRGRVVTPLAYGHLGIAAPESEVQPRLL